MVKHETGNRYGRLLVGVRAGSSGGKATWHCACDCGGSTIVAGDTLRQGLTTSCGCFRREAPRLQPSYHGHASRSAVVKTSPTYRSWKEMWARCTREYSPSFRNYGAKGVSVCAAWKDFRTFLNDMGERPAGTTLDRKRNDIGYQPSNCKWSTRLEQSRNRSTVHQITWRGLTKPLSEWCEYLEIPYPRTYHRLIIRGWSVEDAFTTPNTRS